MTIFLVGSAPGDDLGGMSEVWDAFVACARDQARHGHPARLALCILGDPDQSAEFLPAYAEPIRTRWPEVELEAVHLTDPDDEGNPTVAWPDDFEQLAGVVVCGGWTPGYLTALAPQRDAIARMARKDVPYLGFSAGASIASRHALVGGWHFRGRQVQQEISGEGLDELTVSDGLALVTPLVQVHTDTWSNEGVVVTALENGLCGHAVAIDEATCLAVDPITGRTARLGEGRVRWFTREHDGVLVRTEEPEPPSPTSDQPASNQPASNQPASNQPASDQPASDQPVAGHVAG